MSYLAPAAVDNAQGYWLYLDAPDTVSYTGDLLFGPQQIDLDAAGWHLIGCPANTSVALTSLQVRSGDQTKTFAQAAAANWLVGTLYGWDPGAGSYRTCSTNPWAGATALQPWHGYWLRTIVDNLTLIFPAT